MSGDTPQTGDGCLDSAVNTRRLRLRFVVVTITLVSMGIINEALITLDRHTLSVRSTAFIAGMLGMLFMIRWLYKDAINILNTSSAKATASHKRTLDAEHTQARFLETMSHELRTPLSSIIGSSELLNSAGPLRQDNKHINTISQNCRHLLGLVDGLLDVTKIKSGRAEPTLSCARISGVIEEAIDITWTQASEKGVRLISEIEPGCTDWVITDPLRLRQILVNLLGNAIRHTDEGSVRVVLEDDADSTSEMITLRIIDTGSGISPDEIDRIFETHYQSDSAQRVGSAGLGLSISSELATLLGGSISVTSKLNEGSTFTLRIPKHRSFVIDHTSLNNQTVSAHTKPLQGKTVVLAEDCSDIKSLIQHSLSAAGANVVTVSSGQSLVCAMASTDTPPDIALVDLSLEGTDGITATKIIRDQGITAPVLALSASTSPSDKAACVQAGFDGYLTKPIRAESLIGECDKWLRGSRAA